MTKETKHLLYWQWEWFCRFLRTWYHIFNRDAYRQYLKNREELMLYTDYEYHDEYFGEEN